MSKALYRVEVDRQAQKVLDRLPKNLRQRLGRAILRLKEDPRPRGCLQLKGQDDVYYRIRVGDWRIIYTIEDDILLVIVVEVGPRKDVYDRF